MSDILFSTATGIAEQIRDRKISSSELVDLFVDRIERADADLNAVVVRDFDRAREAARACDDDLAAGRVRGPLHGVPVTIKESYDIAGLPTTWGIPLLKDHVATKDAHAVTRLKEAGAVFLGKTNVPLNLADFQSYNEIYGQTNNPWDISRTPGGSSGGSAAALAAGLSALECGSDIGGSIRNPAHYCGVFGHKPTWGIVPPQGHALPGQLAGPDIAVCGPLARSAEDLALALDIVSGPEPLEAGGWRLDLPAPRQSSLADFRVALWADDERAPVDSEVADRVHRVGEVLARLGAKVSDAARPKLDVDHSFINYVKLLNSVMGAAVPMDVYHEQEERARAFDANDSSQEAVMARALVLSHREWLSANNTRAGIRQAWSEFFSEWDVLVCPQMSTAAFPHDHSSPLAERTLSVGGEARPYFEQLFWSGLITGAYLPSTVFPTGPNESGLPIGLQAVGNGYADRTTIEFTRLLAREIGGYQRPPAYA